MQTIEIKKNAQSVYKDADKSGKELLERIFSKEVLSGDIRSLIDDFDDILALSGKKITDLIQPGDTDDEIAYKQLKLISEVYNGDIVLDPLNTDQYKYYPWHRISGSGLSSYAYGAWSAHSTVGVRLCFADPNHAIAAGKKFIAIYERFKIK